MQTRRGFLKAMGLGAAAAAIRPAGVLAKEPAKESAKKPNLLFIFADDMCFETLHAFGNDEIHTPNLDRLVKNGTTFTHAYNMGSWSGAVCIASRTMLNTGLFVWDAAKIYKTADRDFREKGQMWSQLLAKGGYETYMTGKWHLKADAAKAFDHTVHIRPGMPNQTKQGYNRPHEGQPDAWKPWDKKFEGYWKGGKHWSEVLGDDAETFLAQAGKHAGKKPFFMYLAFNAPHDPRQSPKSYVDQYPLDKVKVPRNFLPEYPYKDAMGCGKGLRDEKLAPFPRTKYAVKVNRQEYYAIITHMDAQVGRILAALDKTGQADNTYIFFTADHGLAVGHHGLIGKQNMFDHSVRVPLVVCGPGVAGAKKIDTPVYLQDIMPTTLQLAGVDKPKRVRFKSLLPLMEGKTDPQYDAIYGAYLAVQRSVTQDAHKLILYPKISKALLFDLKNDPDEMHDLAADPQHRPRVKKLFAKMLALQKETNDKLDLRKAFPNL